MPKNNKECQKFRLIMGSDSVKGVNIDLLKKSLKFQPDFKDSFMDKFEGFFSLAQVNTKMVPIKSLIMNTMYLFCLVNRRQELKKIGIF